MDFELQSFLIKFKSLACAGFKAHLNVSSENNEVFVALNVNLGSSSPMVFSPSFRENAVFPRHRPPAYHWRQVLRHSKKLNNSSVNHATPSADQSKDAVKASAEVQESMQNTDDKDASNHGLESISTFPNGLPSSSSEALQFSQSNHGAVSNTPKCFSESRIKIDPILSLNGNLPLSKNSSNVSLASEHSQELCCIHIHRPGTPPPDGKCCYHRCRPTWTREQQARNYGEIELLSQPSSTLSPSDNLQGLKNR